MQPVRAWSVGADETPTGTYQESRSAQSIRRFGRASMTLVCWKFVCTRQIKIITTGDEKLMSVMVSQQKAKR